MDWSERFVMRAMEPSGAARFAGTVLARHAGDPGAWLRCAVRTTGVARVLLRPRRIVVAGAPATVNFAPRIELRLATSRARAGFDAGRAHARMQSVVREPARTVSAPSAAPMLQRARRRAVRDDAPSSDPDARVRREIPSRSSTATHRIASQPESSAPARVLRRRAPAVVPAPAPVRDEPVVRAPVQPARPVPLSPVEINRLTDHIVQTIDRRIAAFRERQGRV